MSFFRGVFGVALAAILCASTTQVRAADNGECATPEQMTAKLKAEGQRSFGVAERIERQNGLNIPYGVFFTTNADWSVGYILGSDAATGERASKICVRARLADLRLFDARKPGVDAAALLKAGDADAESRCADLIKIHTLEKRMCGSLNGYIHKGEPHHERVMFQGFNVEKQRDGSYKKSGTLTTVTGNVGGSVDDFPDEPMMGIISAILFSSLPDGATILNADLFYAEYTPYGLTLLGQ